jgi:hypothetical protein
MRIVEPPTLDSPGRGHPGDELDGLLSSWFRTQMPNPWPSLDLPEEAVLPMPRRASHPWASLRSRLALAASVALMLVAPWLLSGRFQEIASPGSFGHSNFTADTRNNDLHGLRTRPGSGSKPILREWVEVDPSSGESKYRLDIREQLKNEIPLP